VTLGSDETRLSRIEKMLNRKWPINIVKRDIRNNLPKDKGSFSILEKLPLIIPGNSICKKLTGRII